MHPFDHALFLLLAVAQPVYGALAFRRWVARGADADRVRLYARTMALHWLMLAVLGAGWVALGRPAAALGFTAPSGLGFWVGAGAVLLLVAVLVHAWRSARGMGEEERAKQVTALGKLSSFLPRTEREYRSFAWLSLTAGIVEEIAYRGFLVWYFAGFLPLWASVAASSAIFGLGHIYQGPAAALRTGLVGLVFAVLYVVSGSIWLPILAHAAVDLLQGAMVFELLRRRAGAVAHE